MGTVTADSTPLGRVAVLLIVVSGGLHLILAAGAPNIWANAALVAMAAACLGCVRSLWGGGSLRSWTTMVGLTSVMIAVHWSLCFGCGPHVHHVRSHDGPAVLALVLMAAELVVAGVAVLRLLLHPIPNTER